MSAVDANLGAPVLDTVTSGGGGGGGDSYGAPQVCTALANVTPGRPTHLQPTLHTGILMGLTGAFQDFSFEIQF